MTNETKSQKFGSFQDLSSATEKKINHVMELLDSAGIVYSMYYGYPVIDEKEKKDYVKGIIISDKGIFVLYENSEEQNVFVSRIYQLISQDMELFSSIRKFNFIIEIDLNSPENVLTSYESLDDIFSTELKTQANRAIQTAYGLSKEDKREVRTHDSLGAKIKDRNTYIGTFDEEQFNMIHSYDDKNLRIRGLAGSGKTILLVKKMAYLHFKYPHKKIAFIFYTISLKQTILNLFKKYYKDYDRYGEPNLNNVDIFHSWGGVGKKGFYYEVSQKVGHPPKNYSEARSKSENPYEYVCKELLENMDTSSRLGLYDFVFVDEAQDFKINFFELVRRSLKNSGKLIYAYDELQSLSEENSIPTKNEIFKDEECIDINLKTSYRAPVEILTTAHALGLGINREVNEGELPFVNMLRNKEVWLDIGYEQVSGQLEYGEYVELARNEEKLNESGIINTLAFENENSQYEKLALIIIDLLKNQDIMPEDILIIDLSYKLSNNHGIFRMIFNKLARENQLFEEGTDKLSASINLVNKDNPTRIKVKNAIPYTTIYRAKGNEANLVFIVNSDSLEIVKSISRNKIFTAMTRARYAVWLMGLKQIAGYQREIKQISDDNYILKFTYPTEEQLQKIKTYGELESINEFKMKKVADNISELNKTNPELAKKLLLDMLKNIGDEE
ncbi:DEAD/DEAH box helicase [Rossellomorea marisflavi]|uniref:DEAD/DEAH box helicase n=1 Tax=Rossellomorea marisflavi TaxID=189381 RepID=UPI001EE399CE|nr:ATP-binding domain-containing protein [Rossellomorea marisflavi]UKS66178.1 ATP-binding domain-containing protein [Rossellomorea marisflavi]